MVGGFVGAGDGLSFFFFFSTSVKPSSWVSVSFAGGVGDGRGGTESMGGEGRSSWGAEGVGRVSSALALVKGVSLKSSSASGRLLLFLSKLIHLTCRGTKFSVRAVFLLVSDGLFLTIVLS